MHWLIGALVSLRRPLSEGNAALQNNPRRKPHPFFIIFGVSRYHPL